MVNDDICDVIIVKFDIFKNELNSNTQRNVDKLLLKKQEMMKNFKCFSGDFHDRKYVKYFEKEKRPNKLHIIPSNCTNDIKFKKDFTGLMNKFTQHNKSLLFPKIQNFIMNIHTQEEQIVIFEIVWKFIKQSYNEIYLEVILCFDKKFIEDYLDSFIKNKTWFPNESILNNDMMISSKDDESYELYCSYVKWKKETLSILHCINNIISVLDKKHLIIPLINDLYDLFVSIENENDKVHVLDFILEVININKKEDHFIKLIKYVQTIDKNCLKSSSKFLIMDILQTK